MTIQKLVQKASQRLKEDSHSPQLDAELLLAHVIHKNRAYILSHGEELLSKKQSQQFLSLITRRKKGEPIAYLVGKKEFYSLVFDVDSSVLIPRPETEMLVDFVLDHISTLLKEKKRRNIKIIDVGTGSGNIGIALITQIIKKGFHKKCSFLIYLTEISGSALSRARNNYKRLVKTSENIKVHFVKTDLLSGFDSPFDIIVSNPPYIPTKDIEELMKDVRDFEPNVALNGGERGLSLIRTLIQQSHPLLPSGGKMFLEIHEDHPIRLRYYLKEKFQHATITFKKDMFGQWRFGIITKNV